jgi:hypothetical protein
MHRDCGDPFPVNSSSNERKWDSISSYSAMEETQTYSLRNLSFCAAGTDTSCESASVSGLTASAGVGPAVCPSSAVPDKKTEPRCLVKATASGIETISRSLSAVSYVAVGDDTACQRAGLTLSG